MKITPPIRGGDKHGFGYFGASRGDRTHNGVDIACYAGSEIPSLTPGEVTKIGYPYDPEDHKKGHLRYVEVTLDGNKYRYFYIEPRVSVGDTVFPGDVLGEAQGLLKIYPGITDHIHFEHISPDGVYIDPTNMVMA